MLIAFSTFMLWICSFTINKMKSWGHMKFENESEMAGWNNFKQNIVLILEIGWPLLSC